MAEVGISVASKFAEYLVGPALREGQYLFCVGKITRNLEIKKEELILKQGSVQKCIEEALQRTEEIDDAVKRWKNKVKEIIAEVEDLQQQLELNSGCFRGWCPTWKRYRLCKQLAKKTETMLQLNENSKFDPFSHLIPLPDIEYISSENFMYFKSTKKAEDELLKALRDDNCYMIGLYGMGGSGKTSLATEVGKKAKELKMFDRVVFIAISQQLDVNRIQVEIAEMLGVKLKETSEPLRARRLSMRLKSGERILIILDDVWAKVDFEKIGIPTKGDNMGCKVLLTTRLQQVCTSMDCNAKIPLHLLSEEESWILFKKHAGINDAFSSNSMNEVARGVVKECKGLPIAIVAVGISLKGRPDAGWKVALHKLRHAKPLDVEPGERDAFACLKLSYDYLRNEAAKSILLMCSMFPEDHEIEIEDLFRYGIGLGICGQVDSFEIARDEVNDAIRILVESCLLTYSGKENSRLKMHDMVRDVALWIASKEKGPIMVDQARKLDELLEDESIKDYYAVSSWVMKIDKFLGELNAPKLEILLLKVTASFYDPFGENRLDLSSISFEGVKELKVMAVTVVPKGYSHSIISLPQSTQWLTNLRTLRLVGMLLEDISFVVSLRRLEILDLQHSLFKELPNEIGKLNKLKLLDLSMCSIAECCDEAIRRCSQLEELYVCGTVSINSYETLEKNDNFVNLRSYMISVGQLKLYAWKSTISSVSPKRAMYMGEYNISTPGKVVRGLLQRAGMVSLHKLKGGCTSIIPEMDQAVGSMNLLTKLHLEDCDEIECLVNKTTAHDIGFFQKLETLKIWNCRNLQSTFPGESNLCNLKYLEIGDCPKLTSLFPISVAGNLLKLEEIKLNSCSLLKHIIRNEESGTNTGQEILPVPDNSSLKCGSGQHEEHHDPDNSHLLFPQHDHEDCSSSLNQIQNFFPLLKRLNLESLPCFLTICQENYYPSWPSTKKQESKLPTDVVKGRQLSDDAPTLQLSILGLQHLQSLEMQRCGKVKYVFSMDNLNKSLPCLTSLSISYCEELEEIIYESEEPQNVSNAEVCFPNLKELKVEHCNKLKRLFSSTIVRMLPQLEKLDMLHCEELEEIISDEEDKERQFLNPSNCFPKLDFIVVRGCSKLKCVFPVPMAGGLPQLRFVEIQDCSKLEHVFGSVHKAHDSEGIELVLPKLKFLTLEELPSLIDIYMFQSQFRCGALECLHVDDCPNLSSATKTALDNFPNPGHSTAVIRRLPQLEEDKERQFLNPSNSHPQRLCFPKLKNFEVHGCNKLKCVFPVSMAGDLPQLRFLNIKGCSKLEHVFGSVHKAHDSEGIELVLPKLEDLTLLELPSLIDICAGFQSQFRFEALEDSHVEDCPNLSSATKTAPDNFPKPDVVKDRRLSDIAPTLQLSILGLQHLRRLQVSQIGKVKYVFSMDDLNKSLPCLTSLSISDCEELEGIIYENVEPQNISNAEVCCPNLKELSVSGCNKLKRLFSSTIARMLPQLQFLSIKEAAQLEEVFGHKTEDNNETIVLPNLRQISLSGLPVLVDICQGMKLQARELAYIDITECPKFALVAEYFQMAVEGYDEQVSNEVSDFQSGSDRVEKQDILVISSARHLCLEYLTGIIFLWKGPTLISFKSLVVLSVKGCSKLKSIFSAAVIRRLPRLKELRVSDCEELEEIISDEEDKERQFLSPLNSHPQRVCFPILYRLWVWGCSKLKCVFPVSMAGDLPQLSNVNIQRCSKLEHVFESVHKAHDSEAIELVLPKLESLTLEELPSLIDICAGFQSQFRFEALKSLDVKGCPKLSPATKTALDNFRKPGKDDDQKVVVKTNLESKLSKGRSNIIIKDDEENYCILNI